MITYLGNTPQTTSGDTTTRNGISREMAGILLDLAVTVPFAFYAAAQRDNKYLRVGGIAAAAFAALVALDAFEQERKKNNQP